MPKKVMFSVAELMFNVAELVFNASELMFNDVEHRFTEDGQTFSCPSMICIITQWLILHKAGLDP